MAKEIDIKLRTIYDGKGGDAAKKHIKGIADGFAKVGEALGGANSNLGRFAQNFIKGGIWGAAAELVGYGIKKIREWWNAAKEAAREATMAEIKHFDILVGKIGETQSAIEKSHAAAVAASDARLKSIKEEIDAVNALRKAELELERERLRKAGDAKGADAISGRIADIDADASAERIAAEMEAAESRILAARRKSEDMSLAVAAAKAADKRAADELERALARAREHGAESAYGRLTIGLNGGLTRAPATAEQRSKAASEAEAEFRKGDEFKALEESRKGAAKALKSALEARRTADEALDTAERNLANLGKKADALLIREEARAAKAVNDSAEQSAKAAESVRAAEVKAAQDAARERDRLDRELHARRMDDLRAEIAEQSKGAAALRIRAAAAQGEFDRAFAMYRDPTKAEAAIAEEKDYRADLKRLHKDASRYGGKWRIDELSRLMAAGDSQGVADTLDGWRRLKGFSPQVEAMVRASAAERTKTTAEEELRKIEANTAGLAEKLDALLAMKEGA